MMKELEHCSECDGKLTGQDKERNRDCGIDYEEWLCWGCEVASDPN
jgi:hypothetical protein